MTRAVTLCPSKAIIANGGRDGSRPHPIPTHNEKAAAVQDDTQTKAPKGPVREMVALFATRDAFDRAVSALLDAGFTHEDLSVLASHVSLAAADAPHKPTDEALTALLGELKYAFPLTTAGLIAIVGGPIAAAIAAVVAAGLGGAAIKEYLDEITDHPDTEAFAHALESGGVILWVNTPGSEAQITATQILEAADGRNIHLSIRDA